MRGGILGHGERVYGRDRWGDALLFDISDLPVDVINVRSSGINK